MYVLSNQEIHSVSGGLEPVTVGSFVAGAKGFDMNKTLFYSAAFYGIPAGAVGAFFGAFAGADSFGTSGAIVGAGIGFVGAGGVVGGLTTIDSFIFYSLGSLFYTEKK